MSVNRAAKSGEIKKQQIVNRNFNFFLFPSSGFAAEAQRKVSLKRIANVSLGAVFQSPLQDY